MKADMTPDVPVIPLRGALVVGLPSWEKAPDPRKVAKRVIEGFTQRELPDRWAWPVSTAMHWGYGSSAAALYGILAGSLREPYPLYGLPFGAAVAIQVRRWPADISAARFSAQVGPRPGRK
jgi:hypothetical protein